MHALNADGSVHNQLDLWHARNMPAEECALQIIKKIPSRKEEWVLGGVEKFGIWLKQNLPLVHHKILVGFYQRDKQNLNQEPSLDQR